MSNSHLRYILGSIAALCAVVVLFPIFPALPADNVWREEAVVFADDGQLSDLFGYAVAIDGDTAVVGASEKETKQGTYSGAAYIYVRNGSTWSQQAKLLPNDSRGGEHFGESVAIKSNTVIVGAPSAWGPPGRNGAAYIFTRTGSTWTQKAKLVPPDPRASSSFARAMDFDGDTAVVGGERAVNVFVPDRTSGTWTLEASLPYPKEYGEFPLSVAIDGNTIIAASYIFVRDPNTRTWSVGAELDSKAFRGEPGTYTLDISGNTAVVGSFKSDGERGSVSVFSRNRAKGTWERDAKLTASGLPPFNLYGFGAGLASDGDTIAVGSCVEKTVSLKPAWDKQGVYVFVRDIRRNRWSQQAKIQRKNERGKYISGCRMNFSGDRIIVGSLSGDGRVKGSGTAYIFTRARSSSSTN